MTLAAFKSAVSEFASASAKAFRLMPNELEPDASALNVKVARVNSPGCRSSRYGGMQKIQVAAFPSSRLTSNKLTIPGVVKSSKLVIVSNDAGSGSPKNEPKVTELNDNKLR